MKTHSSIELLEPRIAPAILFTFTDVDGDLVTVKISKGSPGDATFTHPAVAGSLGEQLQLIDLNGNAVFKGSSISVTAKPQLIGGELRGDGLVNVGVIDASGGGGIDLGTVKVRGDLGKIVAGDAVQTTPGVKSLTVLSLGRWGTATGAADLNTEISGKLGALKVQGDVVHALVHADSIGGVAIGGSLFGSMTANTGKILSDGDMGSVKIGGSVSGGGFTVDSGVIRSTNGKIAGVTIGGSVSTFSNAIFSLGGLGLVKIGGDFRGFITSTTGKIAGVTVNGSFSGGGIQNSVDVAFLKIGGDFHNGSLIISGNLGGLTVGGSMVSQAILAADIGPVKIGGEFENARIAASGTLAGVSIGGSLTAAPGVESKITSVGGMGPVKIGGDVMGSDQAESGFIRSDSDLKSVTIGGSLLGGTGNMSGMIFSLGTLGPVKIGGDIRGAGISSPGTLTDTGTIQAAHVSSVVVGGSLVAGFVSGGGSLARSGSIHAVDDIGSVTVKGSIGGNASNPVLITARGQASPSATSDVALKSLTVVGRVEFAKIQLGYSNAQIGQNADAQAGAIKVGGDWIASYVIASVNPVDGVVGNGNDIKLAGGGIKDTAGAVSKIAGIIIGGQVLGQMGTNNVFGFAAEQVGSFKVAGTSIPLEKGASTDTFAAGKARPIGPSLSNLNTDGFAVHVFEV